MMEVADTSNQDLDLIDILWKQDIDLGARREVFDYNHRQKEHELQRQRQLEEEKRLHLLREREKALLAQLKLDEETGEYIPHTQPSAPLQPAVTPLEITQNANFAQENGNGMSFDECLQLLAETFAVEETEISPVCMEPLPVSAYAPSSAVISPEQTVLPPSAVSSSQLTSTQVTPDLEEAWMELLSLPELQRCLNMQVEETLDATSFPLPINPELPLPNYPNHHLVQTSPYYLLPDVPDAKTQTLNGSASKFSSPCNSSVPNMAPPDIVHQIIADPPPLAANFDADDFCANVFYPDTALEEESSDGHNLEGSDSASEAGNTATFTSMDLYMPPEDTFDSGKQNVTADFHDFDSGISTDSSPHSSSPSKSVNGGGPHGYSDSEMDEMDHNPGSPQLDYSEMFSLNFHPEDFGATDEASPTGQAKKKAKRYEVDLAEESGHSSVPFTKDKSKKRSNVRLSRDEQKAKSLKIPFTVDMIINLPVDDFNEMMSKHELNEAQLALVRDIRRRGKNKVAAQNCRKRKMENIVGLENELDLLTEERERLLGEKSKNATDLKEMKRQLSTLYLEVFSKLRDEKGNSYSPSEYSLQQSTEGSIFLVPRMKKTFKI